MELFYGVLNDWIKAFDRGWQKTKHCVCLSIIFPCGSLNLIKIFRCSGRFRFSNFEISSKFNVFLDRGVLKIITRKSGLFLLRNFLFGSRHFFDGSKSEITSLIFYSPIPKHNDFLSTKMQQKCLGYDIFFGKSVTLQDASDETWLHAQSCWDLVTYESQSVFFKQSPRSQQLCSAVSHNVRNRKYYSRFYYSFQKKARIELWCRTN